MGWRSYSRIVSSTPLLHLPLIILISKKHRSTELTIKHQKMIAEIKTLLSGTTDSISNASYNSVVCLSVCLSV